MRVWVNGHEWAKRQLDHQGIGYEALDNGFFTCDDPEAKGAYSRQTAVDSLAVGCQLKTAGSRGSGSVSFRTRSRAMTAKPGSGTTYRSSSSR